MFDTVIWFTFAFIACMIATVAFTVLTNEYEEAEEYLIVNGVTYVVIKDEEA